MQYSQPPFTYSQSPYASAGQFATPMASQPYAPEAQFSKQSQMPHTRHLSQPISAQYPLEKQYSNTSQQGQQSQYSQQTAYGQQPHPQQYHFSSQAQLGPNNEHLPSVYSRDEKDVPQCNSVLVDYLGKFGLASAPPAENLEGEARTDIPGLMLFFDELTANGSQLIEVTYVVNNWKMGGFIPMTHHGFSFKTSRGDYFSLDFGRSGIVWDTFGEDAPGLPDNTISTQAYNINVEPLRVKRYCERTKPFSYFSNDCETWSKGLMILLGVTQVRRTRLDVCDTLGFVQPQASDNSKVDANVKKGSEPKPKSGSRRQRTGDCA